MKLKEVLDRTTGFFKEKGIDTPRLDAELLLAYGLHLERIQLYLKFDQPLKDDELQVCRELVRRRSSGEPVAYIVGYKDFYGLRFKVNSDVLIPRPETEHIVETVLDWAKDKEKAYHVVDLGTGSGCIGLTILKHLSQAKLTAVDLSLEALEVAKQNSELLELQERVKFIQEDAESSAALVPKNVDILVANPPYIGVEDPHVEANVKKFEPEMALFAQENGLHCLKAWSEKYKSHLNSDGIMLMEMGFQQGAEMKKHFESLGVFQEVRVIKDLSGHDRIIYGVKHG